MIAGISCRRLRFTAALAYRAAFYMLVTSPVWGSALALLIVWRRVDLYLRSSSPVLDFLLSLCRKVRKIQTAANPAPKNPPIIAMSS